MMIYLKKCGYSIAALLISILITLTAGGNAFALTPTLDSITPDSGWNNSATEVIINGSNFEEGAEVNLLGGGGFSIVGSIDTTWVRDVYVSGGYAYVPVSGLRVIDISDPTDPHIVGFVDSPNFYSRGVYVSGNYAYVVGNITTSPKPTTGVCLKVIDISDPANPSEVASLEIADYSESKSIYVSGTYAYITYISVGLAGSYGNLVVIDISDPAAPYTVGGWGGVPPGMGSPMEVYISGNYAYLAIAASDFMGTPLDPGLQVIDISDPASPFLIKFFYMERSSTGVFVAGNNAYVTNGSGLQVIDISDPANPSIIGSVDTPGYAYGVYVSGNYAYVADGDSGLQVIDISNSTNPSIVASIDTPGNSINVYTSEIGVYMADWNSGLQVIMPHQLLLDSNVVDSTTITATVPANLPKYVYDIVVTNPSGEEGILPYGFKISDGIVDNTDPYFNVTGIWGTSSEAPSFFGTDFRYHVPGTGAETAIWAADLPGGAGSYEVFVWYPIYSLLATNAPFTINHASGSDTILVNQGVNGAQWVSLGVYDFANDGTEDVTLIDDADTWVAADAVAFTIHGTLPPPQLPDGIVDNSDPEFSVTGIWGTALRTVLPGVYGADFRYHAGNPGNTTIHHPRNNKAIWNAELTDGPGYYTVKIRYPVCPLLAANAPFTINHNGESETILVDQSRNGGKLLNLGIYYFADDGTENIILSDNADSWVVADVVSFTPTSPPPPPDGIVDNFDPKFSLTGRWSTSSNTNKAPDFFGIDFRYHAAGDGTETAIWDTELIDGPGFYEIFVWYPKSTKLATNAAYTVNHNGISDTVLINQGINGGQWVSLGSYEFADDGTEHITLSDNADSWVVADAIRFELPIINVNITSPDDNFVIVSGETTSVKAAITGRYGDIITDDIVTASFSNGDPDITLYDDGAHGDKESNDGIYANEWIPQNYGKCTITVNASKPGYIDGTSALDGEIILIPQIDSLDPSSGSANSDTDITISGYNFTPDAEVLLRGGGPYITGSVNTQRTNGLDVHILGSYAYVVDWKLGLQVIDISDPTSPHIVGSVDTLGNAVGIYVSGIYAYVVDGDSGLQVIDISDPTSPHIVGSVDTPGNAEGIYVSGSYAYVADRYAGLQVIDISNPSSPIIIGYVYTPGYADGVYVSGNHAYVADWYSGLQVIDISNPASPYIVGSVDTRGSAYGVYISGDYAYVADLYSGLQVIDISDPTNPYIVGSVTLDMVVDIYVSGSYAYVVDRDSGLQVIDISDPTSPAIVSSVDRGIDARRIYVSGSYAYVTCGSSNRSSLKIIDISVPSGPSISLQLDINVIDSTTITATVPANLPLGFYDIIVINPGGGRDILPNGFEVF